jgi:hypothetical protein
MKLWQEMLQGGNKVWQTMELKIMMPLSRPKAVQ